jgi:shikimate dehydrogenase
MEHLDRIDPEARAVGAANTIVNREGVLIGCNTDAKGALEALRRAGYKGGMRCLVAGAGGAARAAVFALMREGGEVFIVNRTPSKAEALAREFRCRALGMEELSGGLFDVVVQATSAGMHPRKDECSLPAEVLEGARIAMDMVYNPLETVFLSRARAAGAETVDGLVMFVHQAAEQFRLWTGLTPPIECMDRTARKMIRGVNGN